MAFWFRRIYYRSENRVRAIRKHTLRVNGVITSLTAEDEFWDAMQEIARLKGVNVTALVNEINERRQSPNLSSAVRIFVVEHFMEKYRGYS